MSKRKDGDKTKFQEHVKKITKDMGKDIHEDLEDMDLAELIGEGSQLEKMQKELDDSKAQSADYLDKLRRNMAEFDNYRKRTIKEKTVMFDDGVKDTIDKLIPILDNFDLAVNASQNRDDVFFKGIEMMLRQFKEMLFGIGVEEIPALGCQFDPQFHNAVMHINDEAFGQNEIIEEMRKGYKYKDKIVRHSMVKVAN